MTFGRYFPGTPDAGSVDKKTAAEHAKLMAGYYESSRRPETSFLSILNFAGPFKVSVDKDGLLTSSSFKGRNGAPRRYRKSRHSYGAMSTATGGWPRKWWMDTFSA